MKKNYELTFALIKPHCVKNSYALKEVHKIISKNFNVIAKKQIQLTNDLAENFYKDHKELFFYNRLHTSMCRFVCYIFYLIYKKIDKKIKIYFIVEQLKQ